MLWRELCALAERDVGETLPGDELVYVPSLPKTKSQAQKLLRGPVVYLADGNERPFKLCVGFTYHELLLAHRPQP